MRKNEQSADMIDRKISRISAVYAGFRYAVSFALIIAVLFTVSAIYDYHSFTRAGMGGVMHHDFSELIAENPDTAAWIRMDNTNIDHPVVKGEDNYEYLSLDFYRNDYAGGCIFLDENNQKSLSDKYIIIHGHNMSGGAMFADLTRYLDRDFLEENHKGMILTPDSEYELTVAGAANVDAYGSGIYYLPPESQNLTEIMELVSLDRDVEFADDDKLIVLSTCSGSMDNMRTIVVCRARYAGENKS